MSKLIDFVLQKISIKFDIHKLKKFNDLGFIVIEKIIVNLDRLLESYLDFYEEMVENEINLANISENDRILHVGCGAFPATSILLAKKIGAHITAIDKNHKSTKQARKLISRLNLADKIDIITEDSLKFPVEKFDLILVAQGIKPYKEALEHISRTIKTDARVVIRTTSSKDGDLSNEDTFLKEIFNFGKMARNKKNGLLISVLFFKNLSNN